MEKYIANYRVVIEPDEELGTGKSGFTAYVPKLGIADSGYTIEEVLRNVTEGIKCWIEALLQDNQPVPAPDRVENLHENQQTYYVFGGLRFVHTARKLPNSPMGPASEPASPENFFRLLRFQVATNHSVTGSAAPKLGVRRPFQNLLSTQRMGVTLPSFAGG